MAAPAPPAPPPRPPFKVRIRIKPARAARAEEDAGKQEEPGFPMDHPLSTTTTTKRRPEGKESSGAASQPAPERVNPTGTTRPAARAAGFFLRE
ncbi:hypothetical protein OsJ_24873 [Oryza sativa Japonica Group]|uniref:Uncharacterized protein n=1 Tax=Oryza sativa subsp. japonica TaxID=39947 RepID=B9FY32_ORYSJ|nr:hypothetical protein OsJ_24873 [Oryza sativa Japonica Group]